MEQNTQKLIYDLDFNQIKETLTCWNEPTFRALQVWEGLYKHLWTEADQFSNLSKTLRIKIAAAFRFSSFTEVDRIHSSDLQTTKTLFKMQDGALIETIIMHYRQRISLCISSQAGCTLDCAFCATGQMGFKRNLSQGEIIEQVLWHQRDLKHQGQELTNIVVMGMGEPFLNYEPVLAAINCLNTPDGHGFGERRFTISTAGIVPAIRRFADEKRQINLAVSLHAANDTLRSTLMPINRKYPLKDLLMACQDYTQMTGRRITFEWTMIEGVNDQLRDAQQLIQRVRNMLAHVNLIPLNPTSGYAFQGSSAEQVNKFKKWLEDAGVSCSVRLRRGIDIHAGCGQLAGKRNSSA